MKRVRFLTHVMGLETPSVKCFMAGEVAWVDGDLYDHLARQRTFDGLPWCVEVTATAEATPCPWCQCEREFAPDAIDEHRRFYHLSAPKDVAPAEEASSAPAMVEEPEPEQEDGAEPCPNCHRAFDTPRGLAKHRPLAHPGIVRAEYEAENPHVCEHCDFRSSSELGLQQHVGRMHPEHFESWELEKDPEGYPEKCPFCQDRFESVHGRSVHIGRIHMHQRSGTGPP